MLMCVLSTASSLQTLPICKVCQCLSHLCDWIPSSHSVVLGNLELALHSRPVSQVLNKGEHITSFDCWWCSPLHGPLCCWSLPKGNTAGLCCWHNSVSQDVLIFFCKVAYQPSWPSDSPGAWGCSSPRPRSAFSPACWDLTEWQHKPLLYEQFLTVL